MSPWTLKFRDGLMEEQFQRSWLRATLPVNRVWGISGLTFFLIYTGLLLWLVPEDRETNLILRCGIAAPLIALGQVLLTNPFKFRRFLSLSYFTTSLSAFTASLYLFNTTDSHTGEMAYLIEMSVIFAYCQHYNRIQFRLVVLFTLVTGIATILSFVFHTRSVHAPVETLIAVVVALGLIGIFASYTREVFIRRNFWSINTLKAENARAETSARVAKEANEAKSRFLAAISHELRTPLNAIIGYSEMIRSGVCGPIEHPKLREYLDDIGASGETLLGLVSNVLDLAKAREGGAYMSEDTFDLAALVDEVCAGFAEDLERAHLMFTLEPSPEPLTVHADPRRLRQMVSSLVSNAIKFTRPGGKVSVDCRLTDGGQLCITVRDTGIGISAANMQRAQEMFSQLDDDLNRLQEGAGIGLPLTKYLAELHGGRLDIKSVEGVGTTATLLLPACRVWPSAKTPEEAAARLAALSEVSAAA